MLHRACAGMICDLDYAEELDSIDTEMSKAQRNTGDLYFFKTNISSKGRPR